MAAKTRIKTFQRALARYGLLSIAWLFTLLPYWAVRTVAWVLLSIGFQFILRQKKIARESISIAFGGEKSKEETEEIIKKCFWSFGWGIVELLYYMTHPGLVEGKVEFEGIEKLNAALAKGKGVIAVTAHYGNFPLMMLACAQKGFKTSSIIRPTRDENLEEYLLKRRTECKLNTIYAMPRRACVDQSLKALRENGILFVPIDQNFGNGNGVFVEFFGHKAATATGPVVFARRTEAVILPMFMIRKDRHTHKVVIEDPIKLAEGTEEESTLNTMITITQLVEKYIRLYPHEWAWMHRRWKSQPVS